MKSPPIVSVLFFLVSVSKSAVLDLKHGVIVHMFEWTWADIAEECEEFLGPYNYSGIQISPPNENLVITSSAERPWWERYQPVSYILTTRSGSEDELKDMIQRCNAVGVRVFADVEFNCMSADSDDCVGTAGSTCDSYSLSYPGVPYTESNFNTPQCTAGDSSDADNMRDCDVYGLHDLDQTVEDTRGKIVDFLNTLIDYGVAGFRIADAGYMWPSDLEVIFSRLNDLNTDFGFESDTQALIYLEVIDYDNGGEAIHYYDYTSFGLVTDFRYGEKLGPCFAGYENLNGLSTFGTGSSWDLLPSNVSVVFVEDHDTERGNDNNILNYKDGQRYKLALAFELAWNYSTLTRVLSSYEFDSYDQGPPHDDSYNILSPFPVTDNVCSNTWNCQHRYKEVYKMVQFHNYVNDTDMINWWDNGGNQIAFCRGNKGFVAFNVQSGTAFNETLQTCLPAGVYCDIISGDLVDNACTGKSITVDSDGYALIQIDEFDTSSTTADSFVAYYLPAAVDCELASLILCDSLTKNKKNRQ